MILKSLVALTFASMLALTIPTCSSSSSLNATAIVADVNNVCSYLPEVKDVETILNANPTITNATTIVDAICSGVKAVVTAPVGGHQKGIEHPLPTQVNVVVNGKTYVVHHAG